MSSIELQPVSRHPFRQFVLATAAVLATVAVIAGLILGTVSFVRVTQYAEDNRTLLRQNIKLLEGLCAAQQVTITNQAEGIRDGAQLFRPLFADQPRKLERALKKAKADVDELRDVRDQLQCPVVRLDAAGPIPDVVSDARHRPRNGEHTLVQGGDPSRGNQPQSQPAPAEPRAPGSQSPPVIPELPALPRPLPPTACDQAPALC